MALAPEPYVSACLEVVEQAVLLCRAGNWGRTMTPEQTADLMDAVHNIPSLLQA